MRLMSPHGEYFAMSDTRFVRPQDAGCAWFVIDAGGKVLGRLATLIAHRLRGKHRADFTPSTDLGDHIVVINAAGMQFTGRKQEQKVYYRHSGYPGGIKSRTLRKQMELNPEQVLRQAVKGMLPRSRLGRAMLRKLRIYNGADHPHTAQQPVQLEV